MSRLTASTCVAAVSVMLSAAAMAATATPDQPPAGATMMQSLDAGIRDAQAKRSQHDYAGAIRILSQLMLVAPDDSRVVGEYGKVLVQQGRAREAIDFLNRGTQLQPGDWTLYSALGIAYDQVGDFANARSAYDRALVINPGEAVVLNNFAMSRMLAGDLAQAKRLIAQAAAISKDERVVRNIKLIDALPASAVASATPPHPAPVKPAAPTNLTQHAPRALATADPSAVMMQAIPVDPKAGKVVKSGPAAGKKPTAVAKTARVAKPAATTATNGGIPALRLANDRP